MGGVDLEKQRLCVFGVFIIKRKKLAYEGIGALGSGSLLATLE